MGLAWCALLALPSAAAAQADGFVYALNVRNSATNQVFGFSVNASTGVLTLLPGFPVAAGIGASSSSPAQLHYDGVTSRLFVLNNGANTISVFAVNRLTGGLSAVPFSPVSLPGGTWNCLSVDPSGGVLAATSPDGLIASFRITSTGATPAPGSPLFTGGASPPSCVFSQDGAYFYTGRGTISSFVGFAVDATSGRLTPLTGSPFSVGGSSPIAYATDAAGRLFMTTGAVVHAFRTTAGIPAAVTPNAPASGISLPASGLVSPRGHYFVANRGGTVAAFTIGASGALTAVAGSPFAANGLTTVALAQDHRGSLLFAGHSTSANITTFRVSATSPALTALATQPQDSVGTTGTLSGLAFVPPITGGFVYTVTQFAGAVNQLSGFSLNTVTGALTALPGFPVGAGGTGGSSAASHSLVYDRVNARLYVLNSENASANAAGTIGAFAVNRSTGALTALPFAPITLPVGRWSCLAVSPDGGIVAAATALGVASFKVSSSSATPALSNPATSEPSPSSCAFSQDSRFFYIGGNDNGRIAGFAVNPTTAVLTSLSGSPFNTGATSSNAYATDTAGRLFVTSFGGSVRVFTTDSGIPSAVTGSPFTAGVGSVVGGILTPSGSYIVVDRNSNRLVSFAIAGSGEGTTLTPAIGSPFATGGSFSHALVSDDTGALVFVANGGSRNLTTFQVGSSGALTALGVQPANTLGASGVVNDVAFAPQAPASSIQELTSAGGPRGITTGPDGNVWFTQATGHKIVRITPAGVVAEFPTPTASGPTAITTGPDGNLWYTGFAGHKIGRVTPAGVILEFDAGAGSGPLDITTGPDGRLWFTSSSSHKIGRMTTAGSLTEFSAGITAGSRPFGITAGPDGRLWFTEAAGNRVGRISTSGSVTEFPLPVPNSAPAGIVTGPDGALWFAETGTTGTANRIGRITTSGVITEFGGLTAGPGGIALGPDNNLWFSSSTRVGKITTSGAVTEFTPPTTPISPATQPGAITVGPDGNMWFTEPTNNRIGIVAVPRAGLSVVKNGTGGGTVTGGTLNCGATCGAQLADGTAVTLVATPFAGSRFESWSGGGCTGSGSCTIAVSGAHLVTATFTRRTFAITPATLPNAVVGTPYSVALAGLAENPPVTFGLLGGALPTGVSFSSSGEFSGTPQVLGTFPLNIAAVDALTALGSAQLTLNVVCASIAITPASIATPVVGNAYSQTISQSGGFGAVTFAITSGGLAPGLSLSSDGAVTGTPTTAGAASFTITATDAAGCTGSRTYATTTAGLPTVALSLATVNFGAVNNGAGTFTVNTPPQGIALTVNGPGTVTWTATPTEPWIAVSPSSGSGAGTITISFNPAGGALPTTGVLSGAVNITTTGASNNPSAAVNLTILAGASTPAEGVIETPAPGQANVTGSLAVTGWAVDDIGVSAVRLCREPVAGEAAAPDARCAGQRQIFVDTTVLVSGARPDIAAAFPLKPLNAQAGWGYLLLTNFLPGQGNGAYTLIAYAEDVDGHTVTLGSRTITCANATATDPLGAIDTPAQGGTISGPAFVNFGWALTPQPKSIPTDGSTIQPFIDSLPVGSVTYNFARADIQALFPGFANTNGAVGFSIIDTTTLANGVHTIAWLVTDNQGAAAGIGSRFFTVSNSGASSSASGVAASLPPPSGPAGAGRPAMTRPRMFSSMAALEQAPAPAAAVEALPAIVSTSDRLAGLEVRADDIEVTFGFGAAARETRVKADGSGVHHLTLPHLGRVVVALERAREGARYEGFEIQGDHLAALPLGSHFDPVDGRFTWMPGLGFGGTRRLAFVRTIGGREELVRIDVTIANSYPPH